MEVGAATSAPDGGVVAESNASAAVAAIPIQAFQIDHVYEFSAPCFFDFSNEETEEEMQRAELWFETALSYAQSPFVMGVKGGRSIRPEILCCDFGDVEQQQISTDKKIETDVNNNNLKENPTVEEDRSGGMPNAVVAVEILEPQKEEKQRDEDGHAGQASVIKITEDASTLVSGYSSTVPPVEKQSGDETDIPVLSGTKVGVVPQASDACTPNAPPRIAGKGSRDPGSKNQTARRIASLIQKTSALKPKDQTLPVQRAITTQKSAAIKCPSSSAAKKAPSTDIAQENQAIKRQKLDGGRCHQILSVKNRVLMHKSKPGLTSSGDIFASATKGRHEEIKKEATPFISAAEMVQKFQSNTRELEISQNRPNDDSQSMLQRRPKVLTLTRPKEPELATGHRVRAFRIKSSEELEAEMLAKIPKFKARPVNKKILEAPGLLAPQRSTPQLPAFQEFHLKTMERASRNAGTTISSVVSSSIDSSIQDQAKLLRLTEPRPPVLETSLRARPSKVKSSEEVEREELEKIPKFKARPLNKKILESRGDLGLFCNSKRQITIPQEFHFATDERMGPASASVVDLFDKLSLHSEAHSERQQLPRITVPNPFHLHTEERGLDKGRQFTLQLVQKEIEEERARIPKANPYPYTTDYPEIPPKPAPKECTKPEAFQLESLVRHEEALQRKMEEKERMKKEEAERRLFRAQPVLNVDPFPVAKKERKPLTEVQGFELHVDYRATDRAEFDRKIKEKETVYKRLRDEYEATKMIEEEKAVKQMRRTMVPHARPLPNFVNPFHPQKSNKERTKPKSPVLNVAQRVARRMRGQPSCLSQMR